MHVWSASVHALAGELEALGSILDAAERSRAERFRFERDRRQYVTAHGVARAVLAGYAGGDPAALRFDVGPFGKPSLAGAPVAFNLSHSGDRVVVAVARDEIGVDVEQWRDIEWMRLATSFFSAAECAALRAAGDDDVQAAFYACWSRKEAYLKALGVGIGNGLDFFDVSVGAELPARVLADRLDPRNVLRWRLFTLDEGTGYSAALCAPATVRRVRTVAAEDSVAVRAALAGDRSAAEAASQASLTQVSQSTRAGTGARVRARRIIPVRSRV